jgi:RHS repeat-associated protein
MVVIQERQYNPQVSTTAPQLVVTYTRGRDLSGSLQGAGGIGGLLARTESGPLAADGSLATVVYHADNVGNVMALATTNGQVVASYVYEPFGSMIASAGPMADRNLYRFSSKAWHENSALVYYGYRYYSPNLQRWVNRDPVGEWGGMNLSGFVRNEPTTKADAIGLDYWLNYEWWWVVPHLTVIGDDGVGGTYTIEFGFGGANDVYWPERICGTGTYHIGITSIHPAAREGHWTGAGGNKPVRPWMRC